MACPLPLWSPASIATVPNKGRPRTVGPGPQLVKKVCCDLRKRMQTFAISFFDLPYAGGARPFSRKGPGPKGAEGGIPPFCTFPRCRSVKKMCQWHIFSVGRSGYAARREPWVTVPLCPQMFPCFSLWAPPPSAGQWRILRPCGRPRPLPRCRTKEGPGLLVRGQMEVLFAYFLFQEKVGS